MSQLTTQPDPLLAVIDRAARDPETDVSKMERLLAMAKDIRATEAQSAFNSAMSDAQSEMQPISRDCHNPQTRSKYASYQAIDTAIRPIYTKHGFAMRFGSKSSSIAEHVIVTCCVSHRAGHSEAHELDMPCDGRGLAGKAAMTATHSTGSGLSYGQRYLAKLIWNLSFGESDDDGNGASARQPAQQPEPTASASTLTAKGKKVMNVETFTKPDEVDADGKVTKKGYVFYGIVIEGGDKCGTFDAKLATKVEFLKASAAPCDVTVKPGKKEGTFDLVAIEASDDITV